MRQLLLVKGMAELFIGQFSQTGHREAFTPQRQQLLGLKIDLEVALLQRIMDRPDGRSRIADTGRLDFNIFA